MFIDLLGKMLWVVIGKKNVLFGKKEYWSLK